MNKAVLLLGSNVGERHVHLDRAAVEINHELGTIIQRSFVYETAPWGNSDQGQFLNQVLIIESSLQPESMMEKILLIEEKMGRRRTEKWEPRIIDIDILFYNSEIISTATLTVPHPSLHLRKFTLVPLAEIVAGFIHPVLKKTISELLRELNDPLQVTKKSSNAV